MSGMMECTDVILFESGVIQIVWDVILIVWVVILILRGVILTECSVIPDFVHGRVPDCVGRDPD